MAPPKKPKQTQSKENADSDSDTLEDDKQKPEMDIGSIAQTLKQLSDSFHIMSDRQTQQYKEMSDRQTQSFKQFNDRQTQSFKQFNDRLDRYDSTMQSVQEATVHAFQAKVFGPERDPVLEACAGFSSRARLRYPQTDANEDNNISRRNNMDIHTVSDESTSELGHHVHLRRDEHPKHYHLDHLDRLSNCSTWTPVPVSHSHNDTKGKQVVGPHCHDGSSHPQQSPTMERHTVGHTVAPHTRCIGTSDSTSLITNTHVVKCQATQMTTPNIVANVMNKQSSQATVQCVLYCFTCGGRGHKWWCGVWCGVVWCGVVWCGVVWCGVVWCGVVWCGVVWCGVVWCGVVWCGVVWCGVVWCGVVWCGVVWCGVVWCGVVWCGVVWCGVVWCGVVWCGVVWCGVVWCGVVWCGVVWCGVVWCGVVWCGVVWCGVVWCGVVWCGVVWCGVVWCGVVWCGVVWCGVVWCGVVWCGVVWCGVVWCGVVWCGVVWCGVVWCGVVWCGVVWCGVVWCGVVWCGVVWCGVVWCGVVWCGVVWCGVVWCGVVWCGVKKNMYIAAWMSLANCGEGVSVRVVCVVFGCAMWCCGVR